MDSWKKFKLKKQCHLKVLKKECLNTKENPIKNIKSILKKKLKD